MEKIQPGKYVELVYTLYKVTPDGKEEAMHTSDPEDPERIVFGVTQGVIRPLEEALDGLTVGDKYNVTVKAKDAFGPYDPEQVATLERDIFLVDGKFDEEAIAPGNYVPMMTAEGYRINGKVLEVNDKNVVLDFNHPLAGSDVRFDGTVKTVRDATPEELHPVHSCGCGCGCDDSCDCSEDDHCGCDGHCH